MQGQSTLSFQATQLTLDLPQAQTLWLESFIDGQPARPRQRLMQALCDHPPKRFILIQGPHGSGRSHLLQGLCNRFNSVSRPCLYVPLARSHQLSPAFLHQTEDTDLVCLDDLDHLTHQSDWAIAIERFISAFMMQSGVLMISSHCAIEDLSRSNPTLKPYLQLFSTITTQTLSQTENIQLICQRGNALGLDIRHHAAKYLAQHYGPNSATLMQHMQTLNLASLRAERAITIPFIKSIL